MFNKNFYPTPRALAAKMVAGINFKDAYILEPSAGKGDLADAFPYGYAKVHLIESEPQLCEFLQAKSNSKWQLVANDFLSFRPAFQYDAIVMNPPFDNGAAHFLHAWQIADGCEIRCLLNAETLRNACTFEREQIAAIIAENNGTVEYIQNAFADAERRTGVEVALISIRKPAAKRLNLNLGSMQARQAESAPAGATMAELATPSYIRNQAQSFAAATDALREVIAAMQKFRYHCGGCGADKNNMNAYNNKYHKQLLQIVTEGTPESYNDAVAEMTGNAWGDFFNTPAYQRLITAGVRSSFQNEQKRLGLMAFSEANLNQFVDTLIGTRPLVMEKAVADSFDFLTSYDKKNVIYKEGWKTNSHFKVNKKVIVPALHKLESWGLTTDYGMRGAYAGKFADLERVLCFIAGERYESVQKQSIENTVSNCISDRHNVDVFGKKHDSHFFEITLYKKGTMHLIFKDESLWARFNQAAAKGKNWLG